MTDYATGYSDGDIDTNASELTTLNELADERFSRRMALRTGAGATIAALFGTTLLAACGNDGGNAPATTINAGADTTVGAGTTVQLAGQATNAPSTARWRSRLALSQCAPCSSSFRSLRRSTRYTPCQLRCLRSPALFAPGDAHPYASK